MARLLLILFALSARAADPPEQPIPFNHKVHATQFKIACKMCHPNPDPGWEMTIAPAAVCMKCHSAIRQDSAAIQKLAQYAAEKKRVPWKPVYRLKQGVDFSHQKHLNAKATCADCHANVAEAEAVSKEGDISMEACMTCHQMRKVGFGCRFCHD
jgi:hypothetical protein